MMFQTPFFRSIASSLCASWRSLVATDLLFKLLAFAVLTPLFAGFWHALLAFGGSSVLSDADIAKFFAGPFGWFCGIVLGATWLAIVAVEQASLLCILASNFLGREKNATSAIHFAITHATSVFNVAVRLIGWTLLTVLPFLLIAGAVYFALLQEYDINYYLNERPSEFKLAVAIGIALVAALTGILLRLYSGWFLALPLVLFDQVRAADALGASRELIAGNRRRVFVWLIVWLAFVIASNLLVTATIGGLGRLLIPSGVGSIAVLATRVGLLVLLLAASSLVVNLLATILFAGMNFHGYHALNPKANHAIANRLDEDEKELGRNTQRFTRARLIIGSLVLALCAALFGVWSLNSLSLKDDVQIMAHRGASASAPENTMAAFQQALADGAEWIEIDVQETVDGEVVVVHDSDFMKLSGNPLKIWDATLADLSDIDIGSWVDPKFSDERVPTLTDVLRLCKDKIGVNIELKYYGHDQQLEQRVVDIVEAEQMANQVMVMSLKPAGVAKIKALRPNWRCGLLMSVYVGKLKNIEADFLAVNSRFATRNFIRRAHKLEKEVFVWTVNDAATMSQVLNRKVDGILTDRPALAKQVLQERVEMSSIERLLVEVAVLFNQHAEKSDP
jgi:glycerophosphoryl diester phosphodiesterase